jgi:SAM-dependent methyltransferase
MAQEPAPSQPCPLCGAPGYAAGELVVDLGEVMARWEKEADLKISPEVWALYTAPATRRVRLHGCRRCQFQRFEPPQPGSPGFYADIAVKDYYVGRRWEFYRAVRDLARYRCQRVLDVGCGSGDFLDMLAAVDPQARVAGYEFNPLVAQAARAKGHAVYTGALPGAVIADQGAANLDAVCAFQVVEHVADPAAFLGQLRQLLRPGGLLIVAVPDAAGPLRFFPTALTDIPPHHVTRWTARSFRVAMPGLGFTVLATRTEPLPDYLWESYLPAMWRTWAWPVVLCRLLERLHPRGQYERIQWFKRRAQACGVRWLRGVRGASLYVLLRKEGA